MNAFPTTLRGLGALSLLLCACGGGSSASTTSSAAARTTSSASPASSASPPTATTSNAGPSTTATGAATGSALASASAAPTSPCPEGARKDDDARYCITLPPKPLALSYEGDSPARGIAEVLEVKGDRLTITIGPAPAGKTAAALKEAAVKRDAASLQESGDLPDGYWTERKAGAGKWVVEGVVAAKYLIRCVFLVEDEKNLETARSTCKSLRSF